MAILMTFVLLVGAIVWVQQAGLNQRSPNDLIRHLTKRLQGHDKLEFILMPILAQAQQRLERPTGSNLLPSLGKGQILRASSTEVARADVLPSTPQEILAALQNARAGTIIEIAPGLYPFKYKIRLKGAGTAQAPIVVRAREAGTVILEFGQVEGFLVDQPHWTFENLHIRGVCKADDDCEHAFHIVGNAHHVTLRNNLIEDFNAHIKINGFDDQWPDAGLLVHNTLRNTRPRDTLRSVTPFDLVGANDWAVVDNLVVNFVKGNGNKVSFGMFMKGGSEGGRFERNLVICSPSEISRPGVRVGISFGGGGTDERLCRDTRCKDFEHRRGLAANNIVAHCNDAGLDVNRSTQITLGHNTLVNTAGIGVRRAPADARSIANLFEGLALARDDTSLQRESNDVRALSKVYRAPDALDFSDKEPPASVASWPAVPVDFCGVPRRAMTRVGALEQGSPCTHGLPR